MRPLPLVAAALLAVALLSAPSASAVGESCRGQAATLVGVPEQAGLTGTEGVDVVVTNGATSVDTLGGDDVICITSGPPSRSGVLLDAGAGDDVVDAGAAATGVTVELGAGSDSYTGSPFDEAVNGGTNGYDAAPRIDTERDTITTVSGGDDRVTSGSDPALPNADVVTLGADDGAGFGNSVGWFGPMADRARLDGGGGGARLALIGLGSGDVVLDAAAGTLTEDGSTFVRWAGFDRFSLGGTDAHTPASFTFTGTRRDEQLDFRFPEADDHVQHVDMGGGDDLLQLGHDDNVGARGSTYAGGPGQDHVDMWAGTTLDLDLASGRMETRHDRRTVRTRLTGFETQLVGAKKLVLQGTRRADELRFYACAATVHGRAGKDDIAQSRGDDYFEGGLRCNPRTYRLYGDGGNDAIRGSLDDDVLVGGRGRDSIVAQAGRDRCSGEKLKGCEITLR